MNCRCHMCADRIVGEFRDGFGFMPEGRGNEIGYQSILVPGNLLACHEAVIEHGRLSWSGVVARIPAGPVWLWGLEPAVLVAGLICLV